jgi:hypothetical protein
MHVHYLCFFKKYVKLMHNNNTLSLVQSKRGLSVSKLQRLVLKSTSSSSHFLQVKSLAGLTLLSAGANPTTSNYNASVVNFYSATGSLARF